MAKLSKKKVRIAIEGTGAIIIKIAEKLDVTRQAVYDYFQRFPEEKKHLEAEMERSIDEYEDKLKAIAIGGRWQDSTTLGAIKYYLNNKARKRGYAERQEIEHSGDLGTELKLVIVDGRNENESSDEDTKQE